MLVGHVVIDVDDRLAVLDAVRVVLVERPQPPLVRAIEQDKADRIPAPDPCRRARRSRCRAGISSERENSPSPTSGTARTPRCASMCIRASGVASPSASTFGWVGINTVLARESRSSAASASAGSMDQRELTERAPHRRAWQWVRPNRAPKSRAACGRSAPHAPSTGHPGTRDPGSVACAGAA